MKVNIIGTGSMYTKYNGACTLINDELIVDMPNGTVKQLLKNNFDICKIKTIIITHMHGDHTADIPFFLKLIENRKYPKNVLKIIGPIGIKNKIFELFKAFNFSDPAETIKNLEIEIIEISEENISINNYEINTFEVVHGDEKPCFGYIINKTLGLTGDCILCPKVEELFEKSKIIISDTSVINGDDCHLGVDNLEYLVNKYNSEIIATHLRDVTREYLLEKKPPKIKVVEDFYEFNI